EDPDIDPCGLADKPEIAVAGQLARPDEPAILAAEPDCGAPGSIDRGDELLVDGTGEHHLDHFHRLAVGDPQSIDEIALDPKALQHLTDLRATACTTIGLMPTCFRIAMSRGNGSAPPVSTIA